MLMQPRWGVSVKVPNRLIILFMSKHKLQFWYMCYKSKKRIQLFKYLRNSLNIGWTWSNPWNKSRVSIFRLLQKIMYLNDQNRVFKLLLRVIILLNVTTCFRNVYNWIGTNVVETIEKITILSITSYPWINSTCHIFVV